VVACSGKFYAIGGDNGDGDVLNTCESIEVNGVELGS